MAENIALLRRPEVIAKTGLQKSSIYRAIQTEGFPAPIQLGKRAVAWRMDEIDAWIESRPSGTRTPTHDPR